MSEQTAPLLYYPCLPDRVTGRINNRVGDAMTKEQAENHLKEHHYGLWVLAQAIPQPVTHPYFTDPSNPYYVGTA